MNQTLAKRLWPNEDPIGKHLRSVPSKAKPVPVVSTIIGVVGDIADNTDDRGKRSGTGFAFDGTPRRCFPNRIFVRPKSPGESL